MKTFNITDALGVTKEIEYSVSFTLNGVEYDAKGVCSSESNTKSITDANWGNVGTDLLSEEQWKEIFDQAFENIEPY